LRKSSEIGQSFADLRAVEFDLKSAGNVTMIRKPCISCQSDSYTQIPYTEDLTYYSCNSCGHYILSVSSNIDEQEYFRQQQHRYFHDDSIYLDHAVSWVESEPVHRRVALIRKHINQNAHLIEIGPGSGNLLKRLSADGYRVDAVEESKVLAARLDSSERQKVMVGEFEDQPIQANVYDGLLTFHVIEHIVSVSAHLDQIQKVLKPGAVVVLATPNANSWENQLPFRLSPNYDSAHLHIFSAQSLKNCLERAGFEVLEIVTPEYSTTWIRVFTKILRRFRRSDELTTGGNYLRAAGNHSGFFKLVLKVFSIVSFPLRRLQEMLNAGNEILVVARKKSTTA